ncbi:RICIN domain-containing protein [Actinokineospora auranticolor]|uniref:LGFP repeat-containing protein n=1 Tax=Actinokineospora auranticolor TaxID=155976 RepID=A0A2S6GEM4_9PSEU|nr:LGFP repeat-containing protein [Actinokineospora auranticolor]
MVAGPDLLVLTDRNFVGALYYAADDLDKPHPLEPEHQTLKEAAIGALAADGEDTSTQFIKVGIFAASTEDRKTVTERRQRQEEERTVKSKAAAAISVPIDNTVLAKSTYDFIVYLDLKADSHKDTAVKEAARAALPGTAEAQWNFLVVGIHDEHRKDLDRLIQEDTAWTEAEKAAELARQAKANAAWHALGLGSDQSQNLINLTDQDFVIEVWNRAPRDTEVYGSAEAAVRSRNPAEWKKFIDTGAKDAHLRDIEIMLDKRDREVIRQITELRTRAAGSLVHPDLVTAADTALAAGPADREKFLRVGQYERQAQSLRIEVQNGDEYYLADTNGDVTAAPWTPGEHPELAWKVEPGLSNPECYSFQSVLRPNNYLRWRSGASAAAGSPPARRVLARVDPSDGTTAFKTDATWCVRGDANTIALRPARDVSGKYLFVTGAYDSEANNTAPRVHAEPPKPLLPMDRRYAAEPVLRANLGAPIGDAVLDAGNLGYKPYAKGRLYLNSDDLGSYRRTAVHVVYSGPLLDKLLSRGGPKAVGGAMVDQAPAADGLGQILRFERTSGQHNYIVWSPQTGAREVYGLVGLTWMRSGGEIGPYGYPRTDETGYGDAGVRYSRFTAGSIYWVPAQSAIRQVKGEVHRKFATMGFEAGMGTPTGDEVGFGTDGARTQRFSSGSVYLTQRNGTVALNGEIHQKFATLNYESGPFGYPVSDVLTTSDGVGRYANFAANNGVIYWHPNTGAHTVGAPVAQKWRDLGAERSWLGYPTTDHSALPKGTRVEFQNGRIDSSNDGGASTTAYRTTTVTQSAIEIKGVQSDRCVQVAGVGEDPLRDGAGTELWQCVAGPKQVWDVVSLGNNRYALKNHHSHKCMDLYAGSVANSVAIIQNTCDGRTAQQWEFTTTADSTLAVRNVFSAKVIEAQNGGTDNAVPVTQVADSSLAWQRWTIVPIG